MGMIKLAFRGIQMEILMDDEIVEKIYNVLPSFALATGQKTLFDVHAPKTEEKIYMQKLIADREVNKFPTKEEICDYIKSISPNYEFSLPLVCKHFLGFIPTSVIGNPERKIYEKMYDRLRKAKQIIANEEQGEWKTATGTERETIYRFVKNSIIEGKQSNEVSEKNQLTEESY